MVEEFLTLCLRRHHRATSSPVTQANTHMHNSIYSQSWS